MPDAALLSMTPLPYRVAGRRPETADTVTLALEPRSGAALPPFRPGQFAMLYAFGIGEVPISISSTRELPTLVHTVRKVGAVSAAIAATEPGGEIAVRGPFGSAWQLPEADGDDVLVVAGGIGLAPLRPVVHRLLEERERFDQVAVLYGGRSPAQLLYPGEVEHWRGRFDMQVEVTVDGAPAGWRGRVGLVTRLIRRVTFAPERCTALICGPEVMMRFTVGELVAHGIAPERIYVSMERNMKCALGHCGHCQLGPTFVCKDGPVFRWDAIEPWIAVREL